MRIMLVAPGSRGDVQPFIAIGLGLQRSGHAVRLASNENFGALVREHGLDFCRVAGDSRALLERNMGSGYQNRRGNSISEARAVMRLVEADLVKGMIDCLHASLDADVLVVSPLGLAFGYHAAEKLGLPIVRAYMFPTSPTRHYPAMLYRDVGLGGAFNLWSHHALRQLLWLAIRSSINLVRKEALGLPPLPIREPFQELDRRCTPLLYCFSPSVIPRPPDWEQWIRITGYAFLERAPHWRPPAELGDFLGSGSPPVYVGFGSLPSSNPEETTELVTSALARAGCRGVLQRGWGGLTRGALSDDVCVVDDVPHSWLFPQMAAIVHHGGAGTTAAALRAGIPSIAVPARLWDQPLWAARIADLGVGPPSIPRSQLSADRLAAAIRIATSDRAMRERAADMAARIREEDGVRRAVEAINAQMDTLNTGASKRRIER